MISFGSNTCQNLSSLVSKFKLFYLGCVMCQNHKCFLIEDDQMTLLNGVKIGIQLKKINIKSKTIQTSRYKNQIIN